MKIFGLWWGGNGYAHPTTDDLELFDSLADAKYQFKSRYDNGAWLCHDFRFVCRPPQKVYTPCVSGDADLRLYHGTLADIQAYVDTYFDMPEMDRYIAFTYPRRAVKVAPSPDYI